MYRYRMGPSGEYLQNLTVKKMGMADGPPVECSSERLLLDEGNHARQQQVDGVETKRSPGGHSARTFDVGDKDLLCKFGGAVGCS